MHTRQSILAMLFATTLAAAAPTAALAEDKASSTSADAAPVVTTVAEDASSGAKATEATPEEATATPEEPSDGMSTPASEDSTDSKAAAASDEAGSTQKAADAGQGAEGTEGTSAGATDSTDADEQPAAADAKGSNVQADAPAENEDAQVADGVYTIESALNGSKAIDIAGASKSSGTSAQIYSDNQTPAQRFSFVRGDDGSYTIRNTSSQLVLDVSGAVAANRTRVQQYKANGTAAQKWEIVENADGTCTILSWLRGADGLRYALDVPSGEAHNGTALWIWESNGSKAQKWNLQNTRTVADGTYELYSGLGSERVIDVDGASEQSGANIHSFRENGTMAQRFGVFYDGDSGYYTIVNAASGRGLDVDSGSTAAGANVWQYSLNGTDAQRWSFVTRSGGRYEIVNANSGLALDIAGASLANGANLQQWTRNGSAAQRWSLVAVDPLAVGRYTVVSAASRRYALDTKWGSVADGASVQLYSRNSTDAQIFEVENSASAGYIVIRSALSGKYLTVDPSQATTNGGAICLSAPQGPADWQLWKPVLTREGMTFISKLGLVLDVSAGGMWNGNTVQVWTSNGSLAQKFHVVQAGTGYLGVTDFLASSSDANGATRETLSSRADGDSYLFLPAFAGNQVSITCSRSDGGQTLIISPNRTAASGRTVSTSFTLDLSSAADVTSTGNSWTVYVREGASAPATKLIIMRSANISALFLESADKYSAGRAYVEASSDHSAAADGKTYALVDADGTALSGDLSQIKGRGNSTWLMDKKPYQIKLAKKASLVDGKKSNASKKWVLLANYADPTQLRNFIVLNSAYQLGLSSTPQSRFVDLYYDGEYRGTYQLSEKVEVGKGRVEIDEIENKSTDGSDIEKHATARATNAYGNEYQYVTGIKQGGNVTGGYLLEMDAYYTAERSWFAVKAGDRTYHVVLKSPEDASQEQVRYISERVQAAFNGITQDSLGGLDLESLARTYLIQEFCKNVDYIRHSSTYLYKEKDKDALISGPVWDFDLSLGNAYEDDKPQKPEGLQSIAYSGFFVQNTAFRQKVRTVFNNELKPLANSVLLGSKTKGSLASVDTLADTISASQVMNHVIWPNYNTSVYEPPAKDTYQDNVAVLRSWISSRISWLDTYLNSSQWV